MTKLSQITLDSLVHCGDGIYKGSLGEYFITLQFISGIVFFGMGLNEYQSEWSLEQLESDTPLDIHQFLSDLQIKVKASQAWLE